MFRVYKPKNFIKVRAVQVTKDNAQEVATNLMGRVKFHLDAEKADRPAGVDVPTFDGPIHFEVGSWILRNEDNTLTKMSAEDFDQNYEVARNMGGKD